MKTGAAESLRNIYQIPKMFDWVWTKLGRKYRKKSFLNKLRTISLCLSILFSVGSFKNYNIDNDILYLPSCYIILRYLDKNDKIFKCIL